MNTKTLSFFAGITGLFGAIEAQSQSPEAFDLTSSVANQAIHTVEMENLSGNPIQDLHSLMKHFRCEKKRIQILIDEQKASGTGDEEIIAALEDELGVTVSEAQCYVDEVRTFLTPEQRDFLKSEIPLFVDFPGGIDVRNAVGFGGVFFLFCLATVCALVGLGQKNGRDFFLVSGSSAILASLCTVVLILNIDTLSTSTDMGKFRVINHISGEHEIGIGELGDLSFYEKELRQIQKELLTFEQDEKSKRF